MPDLFHGDAIEAALKELKLAAQQAQITAAGVNELVANANELLLRLTKMIDAAALAGKP
jgi:hypothetical protein